MSYRKLDSKGFTIIELLVVLVVSSMVMMIVYLFFNTSFGQFVSLQQESAVYSDLAYQNQRVAGVIRSSVDVNTANENEIEVYAYFWPNDAYVSKVRYYLTENNTKMLADVTPMSENPPLGTPLVDKMKTYTILNKFSLNNNVRTFDYLDSAGNNLNMPITDLYTIKGVRINLGVPVSEVKKDSFTNNTSVQVTLRNRKTNL